MEKKCPIEYTISLLNGKWKVRILKELSWGPLRYGAVVKCVQNASAKVLIQQLREMEADGLIIRTVFPEVPPKVEYSLSEKGLSLIRIFMELRRWGLEVKEEETVACAMCGKCQSHIDEFQG